MGLEQSPPDVTYREAAEEPTSAIQWPRPAGGGFMWVRVRARVLGVERRKISEVWLSKKKTLTSLHFNPALARLECGQD